MENHLSDCSSCQELHTTVGKSPNDLMLQKMVDDKHLDLYAANCLPKDFAYWIDKGNHYTMIAILYCKKCRRYYFAGYCLYGSPIMKEITPEEANLYAARMEWGYIGSYFKK